MSDANDIIASDLNKELSKIPEFKDCGYSFAGTPGGGISLLKEGDIFRSEGVPEHDLLAQTFKSMGFNYNKETGSLDVGDLPSASKKIRGGFMRESLSERFGKSKETAAYNNGVKEKADELAASMGKKLDSAMKGSGLHSAEGYKYVFEVNVVQDKKGKANKVYIYPMKYDTDENGEVIKDDKGNPKRRPLTDDERKIVEKSKRFGHIYSGRNLDKKLDMAMETFGNVSDKGLEKQIRKAQRRQRVQEWIGRRKDGYNEMKDNYKDRKILRDAEREKAKNGEDTKRRYKVDMEVRRQVRRNFESMGRDYAEFKKFVSEDVKNALDGASKYAKSTRTGKAVNKVKTFINDKIVSKLKGGKGYGS